MAAVIGEAGVPLGGIAISPVTGKAYGMGNGQLYGIDLATGLASLIGGQVRDGSQIALEFTPDGTLTSWGFGDTHLYRVDSLTDDAEADGMAAGRFNLRSVSIVRAGAAAYAAGRKRAGEDR